MGSEQSLDDDEPVRTTDLETTPVRKIGLKTLLREQMPGQMNAEERMRQIVREELEAWERRRSNPTVPPIKLPNSLGSRS